MYELPANYMRQKPRPFDDHALDTDVVWQPDVYPAAAELARREGCTAIVDIGCGSARKLAPFGAEFELVGLDVPGCVDQIDLQGTWIGCDLETAPLPIDPEGTVVICSDVIEHLMHPEHLVRELGRLSERNKVIVSTPDRDRTRGEGFLGPCPNRCHAQEWTLDELVTWFASEGLTVEAAGWTRSNDAEPHLATCLIHLG